MTRSHARTGHFDGLQRTNYHVLLNYKVPKVVISGGRATGVQYVPSNATSAANAATVNAKKEVIIAAGTYHTPQVLQCSGVGPKDVLTKASIPVVVDLPGVGWNLQDHALGGGATFNRKLRYDPTA